MDLNETDLETSIAKISELSIGTKADEGLQNGLQELERYEKENQRQTTLDPRRRKYETPDIKTIIEKQSLKRYKNFVNALGDLKNDVDELHAGLSHLNTTCDKMVENLWESKQNSRNLIEEIAKLEAERKKLGREKQLVEAYLNAFQLNGNDLKILRTTDSSADLLGEEFFEVFEKMQKIQSNVPILLKIGHQTSAVEIMDQISLFQETALEKMYRWAQVHCKHVENPALSEVLSRSLSYLQTRPMLLKYVLDEYCTHRRSLVVRSFIDALTGAGSIKGIELIGSTDPPRYIADMLAWIHQAVPSEKENLLVLLKECDSSGLSERINSCLAAILDGVCRPLNVRMEQSILSGLSCANMNKIDLRLQFYIKTMQEVLPGSQLLIALQEMQTLCHQTFINQMKCQVQAELSEFKPPGPDLMPSSSITVLLQLLSDLLVDFSSTNEEKLEEQFQNLLQLVITPLLEQVNETSNRLGSQDMAVYLCNSLGKVLKFLEPYPFTQHECKVIRGQIDAQIDRLSSEQSSWLVAQLGMGHIYTILHEKINEPLSTVPGMDAGSLTIFGNKLDTLISNPESVLLPQIVHLADSSQRKNIQKQSFKILVAIYKQVYEAIKLPENQYESTIFSLEPEKLEQILCN